MENLMGRFAVSRAGHDADTVYLIIGQEDNALLLCDGRYRTLDKPKKKSRKHTELLDGSAEEQLIKRLQENAKIFDHEIKYAIKKYLSDQGA